MRAKLLAAFTVLGAVLLAASYHRVSNHEGGGSAPIRSARPHVTSVTAAPTTTTTGPPPTTALVNATRASRARRVIAPVVDPSHEHVIAVIRSYPWNADLMIRVGSCESGLRMSARNGRHVGIFQIANANPHATVEDHVALAFRMWSNRGMQPWYPSRHCWG